MNEFISKLQNIASHSKTRNKVPALTEVANVNLTIPNWFTKVLLDPIKNDKIATAYSYAAVWRNASVTHHHAPYPGHKSMPDFLEFYEDPYTLFESDLPDMYSAPQEDTSPQSDSSTPAKFNLYQNYPNPFNPATTIRYDLSGPGKVNLTIFDVLGRELQTLVDARQVSGSYSVTFDGKDLASGIYYYFLKKGMKTQVRKMILLK